MTMIGVVAYYITTKEMPFKAKTKELEKQRVELCDYSWKIIHGLSSMVIYPWIIAHGELFIGNRFMAWKFIHGN